MAFFAEDLAGAASVDEREEEEPVNSIIMFLRSPLRPAEHTIHITTDSLNREIKIWPSPIQEEWLQIPSDVESLLQCTQTLEFNQVFTLPHGSIILQTNSKKSPTIYVVRIEYGPYSLNREIKIWPSPIQEEWLQIPSDVELLLQCTQTLEFNQVITLPHVSIILQTNSKKSPTIYVVRIEYGPYTLDLSQCLPLPLPLKHPGLLEKTYSTVSDDESGAWKKPNQFNQVITLPHGSIILQTNSKKSPTIYVVRIEYGPYTLDLSQCLPLPLPLKHPGLLEKTYSTVSDDESGTWKKPNQLNHTPPPPLSAPSILEVDPAKRLNQLVVMADNTVELSNDVIWERIQEDQASVGQFAARLEKVKEENNCTLKEELASVGQYVAHLEKVNAENNCILKEELASVGQSMVRLEKLVQEFIQKITTMNANLAFQIGLEKQTIGAPQQQFESRHFSSALSRHFPSMLSRETLKSASFGKLVDSVVKFLALAAAGANSKAVPVRLDLKEELRILIRQEKYEAAFIAALNITDGSTVSWLCSLVELDIPKIFSPEPLCLSQGVLLCLLHRLASDINTETDTKMTWMMVVATFLNPEDPVIVIHASIILQYVYQRLSDHITLLTTTATNKVNIHMVLRLIISGLFICESSPYVLAPSPCPRHFQ